MGKGLLRIVFITQIMACAKQGFPPGGPEDKEPPRVIRTSPGSGALGVESARKVDIWFDEAVQPEPSREAVFITPYPGEGVKLHFHGSRLTIEFPRPFQTGRTYVITLGTGFRDLRNNAMSDSYILAFSTGDHLDRGNIFGRVYGKEDRTGIDVWAYDLNDGNPDPRDQEPDYIVQCSKEGNFAFSYLADGRYRLYAILDQWSDRIYQPGVDALGVGYRDVLLDESFEEKKDSLFFQISLRDTAAPVLQNIVTLNRKQTVFVFNEPVRWDSTVQPVIEPAVPSETEPKILETYADPMKPGLVNLITDELEPESGYRVCFTGLSDLSGIPVDSASLCTEFISAALNDTVSPVLLEVTPRPGERSAALDSRIQFLFSEAMNREHFSRGVSVTDTAGHSVKGSVEWIHAARPCFVPDDSWNSSTWYRVELSGESGIKDLYENTFQDSVYSFRALNKDTLSSISGWIFDPDSTAEGPVAVSARQTGQKQACCSQILESPGPYHMQDLLPGLYLLYVYRDRDRDGRYSPGSVFPFFPAERFWISADTVKVRARWPNQGNDLRLPR